MQVVTPPMAADGADGATDAFFLVVGAVGAERQALPGGILVDAAVAVIVEAVAGGIAAAGPTAAKPGRVTQVPALQSCTSALQIDLGAIGEIQDWLMSGSPHRHI